LQIDEAPLTGESDAIKKDFEHPFLLSGTAVLDGEGVMLVVAIGVNSTRGQISALLDSDPEATPLQVCLFFSIDLS
jgi:magnesium-transporting ATPase (P-type)